MIKKKLISKPSLLDIIKINNRWAQVLRVGKGMAIRHLDDLSRGEIEWKEYKLVKKYNYPVDIMIDFFYVSFTDIEMKNIYYDSENEGEFFKRMVNVFGEYVKRN